MVQYGFVSLTRSYMAYRAGRIREFEADARAGLPVALEGALDRPWAVAAVAMALIERDAADESMALLVEQGLDVTAEPETAAAASFFCIRGRLHSVLGRPKQAIIDLERCRDLVTRSGLTSPAFIEWRTDLALAQLAVGEPRACARGRCRRPGHLARLRRTAGARDGPADVRPGRRWRPRPGPPCRLRRRPGPVGGRARACQVTGRAGCGAASSRATLGCPRPVAVGSRPRQSMRQPGHGRASTRRTDRRRSAAAP